MSSPEREKECEAIAQLDKFCKEHNELPQMVEQIHKKLFKLNLADLQRLDETIDKMIKERQDECG